MIDPIDKEARARVIEGLTLDGSPNVSDEFFLANIRSAIRRHHPQLPPSRPITIASACWAAAPA